MEYPYKEVYYDEYCKTCQYYEAPEWEDPCWDCLNEPSNLDSHKPTKYKKKEESK